MEQISDNNINDRLKSMKNLMQIWTCRNITPIGRIAVYKSLIVSKIIHILQSRPTPTKELLLEIEKLAINFIWKGKRHEVNKKTIYMNLEQGGLQMLNMLDFDNKLKLTWLNKLYSKNVQPEWGEFAEYNKIDRLLWTVEKYHVHLLNNTKNPFWKSLIKAYQIWYPTAKTNLEIPIQFEPLWGNPTINIPFNAKLYTKNILFIQDIINHEGEILSKQELEIRLGETIMLTTYFGIRKAIPKA